MQSALSYDLMMGGISGSCALKSLRIANTLSLLNWGLRIAKKTTKGFEQ